MKICGIVQVEACARSWYWTYNVCLRKEGGLSDLGREEEGGPENEGYDYHLMNG
jgi:hypothetical protein